MNGTILSLDTPFFTKPNEGGQYQFFDLPAGTYGIRVYHPDFPAEDQEIALSAGDRSVLDITLSR